jgi:hypothetical protein
MIAGFVALSTDPYSAADTLHEYSMMLFAQGSRKTKDIVVTLENLALFGEELLARCQDKPAYVKLNQSVTELYRLYRSVTALPKDSDEKLKKSVKSDPKLLEFHWKSYKRFYEKLEPYAEAMLARNPEFKLHVDVWELTELLVNAPIVTADQPNDKSSLSIDVVL